MFEITRGQSYGYRKSMSERICAKEKTIFNPSEWMQCSNYRRRASSL